VKLYGLPTVAEEGGVPEIVGAVFAGADGAVTVMENAESDELATPSLTLITMFENVPSLDVVGVPDSVPVLVLNDAHEGFPEIENVSV
jgi:hypothetical protein